jgi:hypothetical protein
LCSKSLTYSLQRGYRPSVAKEGYVNALPIGIRSPLQRISSCISLHRSSCVGGDAGAICAVVVLRRGRRRACGQLSASGADPAGAAGALMGVVWNYAMCGLFVWRNR